MSETPEIGNTDLIDSLERIGRSMDALDQALEVTFEVFSSKGLKPSIHLTQAQEKMRKRITEALDTGKRVANQLEQLNGLVHVTALITSTLESSQVIEDVMDTVVTLTGAERAYLMLYNNEKDLEVRAARNWDQESLGENEIGLSQSVVNAAIESQEPIITTNAQADERFSGKESIVIQKLRSIICLPLSLGGKLVGVLYADNRYEKALFSENLVPILTAFGTQAAIAITNAHMFGMVKQDLAVAQKMIHQLQIEIDKDRVDQQVEEITETSYFKELAEAARALRDRRRGGSKEAEDNPA